MQLNREEKVKLTLGKRLCYEAPIFSYSLGQARLD